MSVGPYYVNSIGCYYGSTKISGSYVGDVYWGDTSGSYETWTLYVRLYAPDQIEFDGDLYTFSNYSFSGADVSGIGLVTNVRGQTSLLYNFSEAFEQNLTLSVTAHYTKNGGGGGGRPNITITATVMPDNSGLVQINGAQASMTQTAIVTYGNPVSLDTAKIPYSVSGRDFRFLKWVSTDGNESYDPKFSYVPMRDAVWIAMYVEIYHEGLILYDKNKNPSQVLYDSSNDKIMRDIRTGEIEV